MPSPTANGYLARRVNSIVFRRKRNGKRRAEADWSTRTSHGATRRRYSSNIFAESGRDLDRPDHDKQTDLGYLIWATMFTNGAWTGIRKPTMQSRRLKIPPVRWMECAG